MSQTLQNAFPGKAESEALFVFARPYAVAFIPTALVFIAVFLISIVLQATISNGSIFNLANESANWCIVVLGLFQFFTLIIFLTAILDFYYDVIIVTDRRVVDIDQEQLFYRSISELNLEDIEDVKSFTKGFFQTTFNYGTIMIQTAGAQENFILYNFKHPREIASIISDLADQAKEGIDDEMRIPHTGVMGVVSNATIQTFKDLAATGAVTTDDPRRNRK